jgi:NADPH:quinone reductase-like Zn-dependent oxidoreductase
VRACVIERPGDASVLVERELPTPEPGPGQVRVAVHACALNRLDIWVRNGLPHLQLEWPHILGSDVAGVVDRVGAGADPGLEGAAVIVNPGVSCGRCRACLHGHDNLCPEYKILGESTRGGYAEYVVVPAANVVPLPAGLDFVHAAALPLTFLTAWQMLVVRARVRPGDVVLLHAAGSGVGVAGLQIAKLLGARVIALASTARKLELAAQLGADVTISTAAAAPPWWTAVRAVDGVGRRGVDVVFEHVGAATWAHSLKLTRNGGTVVTCGASSGHEAVTDLRHVFFRQLQLLGSTMGSKADLLDLLPFVASGQLRPVVDRTFPLAEAAAAHIYLDRREQFGKVVLEVR